jgi:dipeptidyl aminopeptidase/acylaminoacyl peptidase
MRLVIALSLIAGVVLFIGLRLLSGSGSKVNTPFSIAEYPTVSPTPYPLSITSLRSRSYDSPAPTIIENILSNGAYTKDLVSYTSDGLKIYAVMTMPSGDTPAGGWPVIILNHGYIPPAEYDNTAKYVAYIDTLTRAGYVVFMSDYRGHGNSEGIASGGYYDPGYTIDVMNGIRSIQKNPKVNPDRLYLWGHSMGGNVSMRVRAIEPKIKATVIWAGVVGSYPMIFKEFFGRPRNTEGTPEQRVRWSSSRMRLIEQYGTPSASIPYWRDIDPMTTVADIKTPIQIHHGEADETVPLKVGQLFASELKTAGVAHELYTYPGENHNINGPSFGVAMQRTTGFFGSNK